MRARGTGAATMTVAVLLMMARPVLAQAGARGAAGTARAAVGSPAGAAADTAGQPLSLEAALARALDRSEEVRGARAQVKYASAQVGTARASALPQVNTQLAFTRLLRSVYQGVGFTLPDSLKFEPNPDASLAERVKYLEDKTPNAALGALGDIFGNLPFGRPNTWVAGLTVAQPIFAGGRIRAGIDMAEDAADAARASLEEARGDVAQQVKQAYYDAVLAGRSATIMEESVELARRHLAEVKLREDAGRASELDTLRAAVDLENLVPQLVQARNARDLALLNLKRLVNLPADGQLRLTTELQATTADGTSVASLELPTLQAASPRLARRATVVAAEKQISVRRAQVSIARAAYLPTVALTGNLNRQAYPAATFSFPSGGEWRDDWNVGFLVQWPLFQGFRRGAEMDAAHAQLDLAELQHDQLIEGVRIEYDRARGEFARAQAQIAAAARTSAQAQKVYELTELRYQEGQATQLDVSTARLSLQQARINEVQAYHDAYAALAAAERALGVRAEETTLP